MKATDSAGSFPENRADDYLTKWLVWGIWLFMLLIALICIAWSGYNIPLAEDWVLVAPLTGHESDFLGWLWAQNNEHRIPLPRLMLLALLKLTGGDFRSGMVFNVLMLAIVSAAMIGVTRQLRGGRTQVADAFFPIALLHLGNWENLVWSWQLSFVFPTAIVFMGLLLFVSQETLAKPTPAILMATGMVLLPLCGANGLLFTPFLALWCSYSGIRHWRNPNPKEGKQWVSIVLIASAIIALTLIALYFVGYQSPTWNPPNPGLMPTLKTSAMFLALGFGSGVQWFWSLGVLAAFAILLPTIGLLLQTVLYRKRAEQHRAIGILLFFGNLILVALAMGWGRAALVPQVGLPMRYVLLSVPMLCLSFLTWELYGKAKFRRLVQTGLLVVICLLLPFNTLAGLRWRSWYVEGMNAVEQDLRTGTAYSVLARNHKDFLIHWWDDAKLAEHIQMLHDAGISHFAKTENTL